ncbi:MAG: hypothetical protein R3239_01150 [Thermodesulfobacteriota bacterium]|nr:hypothetical protein [Thermodesulfobacteriota bacterium]
MDTSTDTILRVGTMLDFRKSRRSMHRISLAKLAQKLFSVVPGDIIYLGSESALGRAEVARNREDALIAG